MNILEHAKTVLDLPSGRRVQLFSKNNPELVNIIFKTTSFLPNTAGLKERSYCILHNNITTQKCKMCSNNVKWDRNRYKTYCSLICKGKDPELKLKVKNTVRERFGVDNPSQHPDIKNRKIETCITNHGVKHPQQSKQVRNKTYKTMNQKYGASFPIQVPDIKKQIKLTLKEHLGVENPSQSKKILNKKRETSIKNYSKSHHSQQHMSEETLNKLNNKDWLYHQHYTLKKSLLQISKELNISDGTLGNYLHKSDLETIIRGSFICEHHFNEYPEDKLKDSILYIIQIFNETENFIKIGITTDFKRRFTSIPYSIKILNKIQLPLYSAWLIEQETLRLLKEYSYLPKLKFGGQHECLLTESYKNIVDVVNMLLN